MTKILIRHLKYTFIFLIFISTHSLSDEFNEIMDSINEIKNEFNSLTSSEVSEAKIIDEAVKELSEAVDFASKSFDSNDIESTVKALEFVEDALGDVSKLAADEISSDMSEVNFDELKDETTQTLIDITNSIKTKNEKKTSALVSNMIDINKKGLDTFSTTNKLKDLGVETLGTSEIKSEISTKQIDLESAKKELEEVKSTPKPELGTSTSSLNELYDLNLKEVKASNKVKKLSSEIKSLKNENVIYNVEVKPDNYKEALKRELSNLDKTISIRQKDLETTKKELTGLMSTKPEYTGLFKNYSELYYHNLKEIQARDKVKSLLSDIENIKETTEAIKNEDLNALKDINNINPLLNRRITIVNGIGQVTTGLIVNSTRGSNVVQYIDVGISAGLFRGQVQTAVLLGNSRVKELTSSIEEVKSISKDVKSLTNTKELKSEINKEVTKDVINVVKLETRDFAYNVTKIENEIKEIQELAKEGVVDLESKAKELGFNNFAEGVEAYNKQNNTNYTVEEAKTELGQ